MASPKLMITKSLLSVIGNVLLCTETISLLAYQWLPENKMLLNQDALTLHIF